jgi:type VII secretion-associated serine protease mycosin
MIRLIGFCLAVVIGVVLPTAPVTAAPRPNSGCGAPHPQARQLDKQPWPLRRLKPSNVWAFSRGQGVTVAVIDSGVSPDHPKLSNGKVLPGYDFVDNGPGGDCDAYGHGTFVAGLIAGRDTRERDSPFSGIAPDALILPLRVIANDREDPGESTPNRVAAAIDFAIGRKVGVINLSLYAKDTPVLAAAIDRARRADIVIVAAAGNGGGSTESEGRRFYPAAYDGVLAVAGVDEQGRRAQTSSPGDYVDVAAPGVDIDGPTVHGGGYVTEAAGTSYAAAYVSGVVAVLRGYYKDVTADRIVERITKTADRPPLGRDDDVGYGVINPYRAMTVSSDPASASAPPLTGELIPLSDVDGPLWADKLFGLCLAGVFVGLTLLLTLFAWAVPRGIRRGWRPGQSARPRG